jgi:putative PEP-CTERM system TPR-repeat lipoprotein
MHRFSALFLSAALFLALVPALAGCDSTTADEYLDRARTSIAETEYRTAVIELKNALQKQPELGTARKLLGQTYYLQGDFPGAVREFERALDLGIPTSDIELELLSAKNRIGRYQEVIGALAQRSDPVTAELKAVLADAYFAAQDLTQAESLYQQALTTSAGNLGLGRIAWMNGDLERARHYLNASLDIGVNVDTLVTLAEFELATPDLPAAQAAFELVRDTPSGELTGELGLGRVALARGDLDAARTHIDTVLNAAPQVFIAHYLDALIKFQNQDLDGAEAALREVQRGQPGHPPSLFLMGVVKYQQGQLLQAQDNLQRYLAVESANESAAKILATLYFQQNDLPEVVEVLQDFAATTSDPQLLAMLGTAQLRSGSAAAATESLEAAVQLAPDAAAFKNQLALSFLSIGDSDQAEAALNAAIEVDGDQFQSDYLLAMMRLRDSEFQNAMAPIDALISKNADSPLGFNLKGAAYLGLEERARSRSMFERALEVDPGYLPALTNLARLDIDDDDIGAAQQRYQRFLKTNPLNEPARLALARLYLQQSDIAAARRLLEQALIASSDSAQTRLLLASLDLQQDRVDDASAQIETVLEASPDAPDALLLAAQLELRRGDVAAARNHTKQLQLLLGQSNRAEVLLTLAALQVRTGEYTLARRNLESALQRAPASPGVLFELARLELRENQVVAARRRLDEIDTLQLAEPQINEQQLTLLRADVLQAENSLDAAADLYATLAREGSRDAVIRLITLAVRRDQNDLALAESARWLSARPDDVGVRLLRADVLLRTADNEAAIEDYQIVAGASNPVALNNLAWLYLQKDDSRALATAQRAYELAPENPDIADTLGWILVQQGQAAEGLKYLEQSVEGRSDNPSVRYHLAQAHADLGDPERALTLLEDLSQRGDFPEQQAALRLQQELSVH